MRYSRQQPKQFYWWRWLLGGLLLIIGGLVIFWCLNPNWLDQKEADLRVQKANHMAITTQPVTATQLQTRHHHGQASNKVIPGTAYGDSSNQTGDISPAQLKKDAKAGYPLYKRGEIAIPQQPGLRTAIHVAIFEGTSVTALAYGAGTAKPNEKMGHGNYALSAHNMADNVTYFSPLQSRLQANQRPYAYVTNQRIIYRYRIYSQQHDPQGKVIVPLTDVGVLNDPADGRAQLTLTTCYEVPPDYANATKRVIVRGELVNQVNWKKAPATWRALFKS